MDESGRIITTQRVEYKLDLPKYSMDLIFNSESNVVTQKAQMFYDALILVFDKLKESKTFNFSHVKGISGCGQQHGSV